MDTGRNITTRSSSNLACAFRILPKRVRKSMYSLYAFCREVDDVADDDSRTTDERRRTLDLWREDIRRAASGGEPELPVNRELIPVIGNHSLPLSLFEELLAGVESDLTTHRYPNHEELQKYCYRVASVVGLLSVRIFGCRNPLCNEYAVQLGLALQYTNILRDVASDARRGRIYLPREDLDRFHVREEEILDCSYSTRYRDLAGHAATICRGFYRRAETVLPSEDRRPLVAAIAMGRIYRILLSLLEARSYDVFGPSRVSVPRWRKAALLLSTWLGVLARPPHPPAEAA